ncbi:MAG: hypothetical protein WCZ43_00615 [Proteiniphilum sp.]
MNLEARKIIMTQEFLRLDDENMIRDIEDFLRQKKSDLYEKNLTPMSLEQLNDEIEQSLANEREGRWIYAEDLGRKIDK